MKTARAGTAFPLLSWQFELSVVMTGRDKLKSSSCDSSVPIQQAGNVVIMLACFYEGFQCALHRVGTVGPLFLWCLLEDE